MPERKKRKRKAPRSDAVDMKLRLKSHAREADYGDATPEDVAKAVLNYRPKVSD